jgi:hypothetical protein
VTFIKKPLVVEAIRVSEVLKSARSAWSVLPEWVRQAYESGTLFFGNEYVIINYRHGRNGRKVEHGFIEDWIIKGVWGELSTCDPAIFEATYELAESTSAADSRAPQPPKEP